MIQCGCSAPIDADQSSGEFLYSTTQMPVQCQCNTNTIPIQYQCNASIAEFCPVQLSMPVNCSTMHCMSQLPVVTMQSFLTILSLAKVVKVHEPLACFKCSSSYTQCTMSTVEWSRAENVFIQEMGWLEANGKSSGEEGQAREVTDALRVIFQSSELFRCNTISYTYSLNESQKLQQHFFCCCKNEHTTKHPKHPCFHGISNWVFLDMLLYIRALHISSLDIFLDNFWYSSTEIEHCMSKCTDVCMTLIQYLCKMNPFHLFSLLNIALKATDCSATLVHRGYF